MSEAARYLRVSPATLRSWFIGRPYPTARGTSQFRPLLKPARVETFLQKHEPPFIAKVYRASPAELEKNPSAPGHVALWVDA